MQDLHPGPAVGIWTTMHHLARYPKPVRLKTTDTSQKRKRPTLLQRYCKSKQLAAVVTEALLPVVEAFGCPKEHRNCHYTIRRAKRLPSGQSVLPERPLVDCRRPIAGLVQCQFLDFAGASQKSKRCAFIHEGRCFRNALGGFFRGIPIGFSASCCPLAQFVDKGIILIRDIFVKREEARVKMCCK